MRPLGDSTLFIVLAYTYDHTRRSESPRGQTDYDQKAVSKSRHTETPDYVEHRCDLALPEGF